MYKLLFDYIENKVSDNRVFRIVDNTTIPFNSDNTDYQEYLKWVAEGNTPEAAE